MGCCDSKYENEKQIMLVFLLLFNTTKSQKEIQKMKILGAKNGYAKAPENGPQKLGGLPSKSCFLVCFFNKDERGQERRAQVGRDSDIAILVQRGAALKVSGSLACPPKLGIARARQDVCCNFGQSARRCCRIRQH